MTRALYVLLAAVALAAAVLSFAALRDLALLCGFARPLAWLLPVVVDAGAVAGTLVWLGGRGALVFARRLALGLLAVSIAANGLSHGAAAWAAGRPLWVVVVTCLLSGLAPAVLGAVIHLVVRHRQSDAPTQLAPAPGDEPPAVAPAVPLHVAGPGDRAAELIAAGYGRRRLAAALGIKEHEARELIARHEEATG